MAVLTDSADSRSALNAALTDPSLTLLLLSGSRDGIEHRVHDTAEQKVLQSFERAFLITSLDLLSRNERESWFDANGKFAVTKGHPRQVTSRGDVGDRLLTAKGNPSVARIRREVSA